MVIRTPANPVSLLAAAVCLAVCGLAQAADVGTPRFDTRHRVPWTTSRLAGTPDAPPPYRLRRVFERLRLEQPVFLTHLPGTGRLIVVQQQGKIVGFSTEATATTELGEPFLDVGREAYSLAFHPRFAENRWVYVFSNGPRDAPVRSNRIARFTVAADDPPRCDPESEVVILEFESNGHNGGDLAFGPDGLLYVTAGDGTSDSDTNLTGQDLRDLVSAVLRIDVDHPADDRAYAVPADNPFVGRAGARPELWAYGFRNPWRMCFEPGSGRLWVGDVGQDAWEMIHLVTRGGNYGWSVMEAGYPFQPRRQRGPTPILPPIAVHPHSQARSITGGRVYAGDRLAELRGAYIYGDYATGKVWGLRYDGQSVAWQRELADSALAIVSFGEDAAGELYIVDHAGGLYQLEPDDRPADVSRFPRRLSETGLFAAVAAAEPAPGVIPYSVNSPLWSDGAEKERWLAIPGSDQIQFAEARGWNFSDGAVAVKTFSLELRAGDPASRRRVETRLLVREQGEWAGYSYLWNDAQNDADLVAAEGTDRDFAIVDGTDGNRKQVWHFPSRAECMVCHTRAANYVLGLSTAQMNRRHDYGDHEENQIDLFARLGLFRDPPPKPAAELPALADPIAAEVPVIERARSYLHANCAQCHVSAGGGNSRLELEFSTPFEKTNLLAERPLHDSFGVESALLLAPGKPERSLLLVRIGRRGTGQMPPLATSRVDSRGVELLAEWIRQLPAAESAAPPPAPGH